MKRTFKIGIWVLVVGVILIMIGAITHSFRDVTYNKNFRPELAQTKTVTKHVKAFDTLTVNLKSSQLRVKEGDEFRVQMRGESKALPTVEQTGKTLKITQHRSENQHVQWGFENNEGGLINFSANDGKMADRTVVVTVPRGTKLNVINAHNDDGSIRMTDVSTKKLTVNSNSDVSLETMTIEKPTTIKADGVYVENVTLTNPQITSSDDVALKNVTLNQGTIKLNNGDFRMHDGSFTGVVSVFNDDGDNTVVGADHSKGYIISHTSGGNALFDQANSDGGQLQQNETNADRLQLNTNDGDNSVK
ncbi:DUF4097 family beta strand repeat-containing protein [Furfurilactobacillus sp. WILCCON 0119]